ncbi:late competence protein ComER [Bacillus mesophilum]|uniref:Pyrroline-5-carboxylate reductase n=1 Tax=Bacillus mesophilum TaxID=1071718 RepID=A0A7V7RP94_9BACI|nr:late competence protein ComER [Bacillus mesophilum]KAB2333937.1 late competence protein ComER [Bacillus mesophilum]
MKIGVIGTGNMGRILTEAFIDGGTVLPEDLMITNRTLAKALPLQEVYSGLNVGVDAKAVAEHSDLIFICVKPHDVYHVISSIQNQLTHDKCVVSITSPISIKQLESIVPCSAARAIPSITNRALAGVSLLSYGDRCNEKWKVNLKALFASISAPVEIEENITRVASDIVSCGPAFYSYLTQRFITAAVNETEIDQETATKLAGEMLIGLGELLRKGYYTLPTLQEKVCVKGGITGEGIKVLESELGDVFEQVFKATHAKFADDLDLMKKQYTF